MFTASNGEFPENAKAEERAKVVITLPRAIPTAVDRERDSELKKSSKSFCLLMLRSKGAFRDLRYGNNKANEE